MKTYDVIALGELLIDFTQNGLSAQGNGLFEANPGGAPCNVLSMLNRSESFRPVSPALLQSEDSLLRYVSECCLRSLSPSRGAAYKPP